MCRHSKAIRPSKKQRQQGLAWTQLLAERPAYMLCFLLSKSKYPKHVQAGPYVLL
jgi:hypothetical protein